MKQLKKILSVLLILAMVIAWVPPVTASAEEQGYYTYYVSNNKAIITGVDTSITGDVVIPNTLGRYAVVGIDEEAFKHCHNLVSVTITNGVISIGSSAFAFCSSLKSVTIPESVNSIGSSAFSDCVNLENVNIPRGVLNIGEYAFRNCNGANGIWVDAENSAYCSDEYGVLYTKDMTTLIQAPGKLAGPYVIPAGVTSVGGYAFYGCEGLTSVNIPDTVENIGELAFFYCNSLTEITLGESVKSIGKMAFSSCSSLETVYYDGTEEQKGKIDIGNYNEELLNATWVYAEKANVPTECVDSTITFDSTTKRTKFSTSVQVWEENGVTVTNNKGSGSNIADYAKPARFYANSELVIEMTGMTEIVFDANSGSYATALKNSIDTNADYSVNVSSDKVTVTFNKAVDSFTISKLTAQVRMDSITVTVLVGGGDEGGSEGGETPSNPVMHDVSFNLNGYEGAAAPATIQVEDGKAYGDKLPSAPEREGYTFEGWAMENGTIVTAETIVSASHILYAQWEKETVVPDPTPGETEPDPTPCEPTELTITFDDTAKRIECSTNKQVWQENEITITHNKGTGSNIDGQYFKPIRFYKNSNFTVECGGKKITKIVFNANTTGYASDLNTAIKKDNYSSSVNGKVVTVIFENAVDSFAVTLTEAKVFVDSITVTVLLPVPEEPTKFDVSFDLNGAEGTAPEAIQVEEGKAYGELPEVSREGYTFDGWFTEAACTNAVTAETIVTESHTLYAKWTYIPPEVPEVKEWSMTLEDELVVNFKVDIAPKVKEDPDAYVEVKIGSNIIKTPAAQVGDIISVPAFATQMMDVITLSVVDGNNVRSEESNFTIRQYCETILADGNYSQYHQLVKEMLNYGSAAQIAFDRNKENLANKGVDMTNVGEKEVPTAAPAIALGDQSDVLDCTGASLVYRDKIAVRYYFTGSLTGCTFSVTGANGKAVVNAAGGYVEVPDILPQDLDQEIALSVTDGEGKVLTITYCPMNYIVRMSQKGSDTTEALVKALYNYYFAAKDFAAQTV